MTGSLATTRTDLGFLRRRRPVRAAIPAPAAPTPAALELSAPELPAPEVSATSSLASALPPAPKPLAAAPALTTPHLPPAPKPLMAAAPAVPPAAVRRPTRPPLPAPLVGVPSLAAGEHRRLSEDDPLAMLPRAASGLGALECRVVSTAASELAVAYEVRGIQGVLTTGTPRHGPGATHPRVSRRDDHVSVDLGHLDEITRFAVLVRGAEGTLVTTTATGARVDVELSGDRLGVALTGHVARGCLVLRAEGGHGIRGTLRDVVSAYGYDAIAWASAEVPLPPNHTHPHEGIPR
ncbi:hypothetical protein LEP48_00500 [Isoptericola sp. NEAU-Y5]|uniref:Uncharacterized protein n=1 Tax=Isoptericola luteus TaxID=2879484 RepID=A0ABS7ZDC7_9MICO|nr:hypothetical protein [Isoptericola sp. NEAU-Y5]MCA5891829.1 hypothetical protein [Isoptericola sp. NEAU-Y5]